MRHTSSAPHDFATRFREALAYRGISYKKFAGMVHVSPNTVSNWATGRYKPDHEHLQQIAAALDMTLDELHGRRYPGARRFPPSVVCETTRRPQMTPLSGSSESSPSSTWTPGSRSFSERRRI
jgi:transcriptional regulator with XRE-family HTH domain